MEGEKSTGSLVMPDLSEDQMTELQQAFEVFDRTNEGTITTRKLFHVMRSLGQNPTEAEVQDLINAVDYDGNGTIEFDEFVSMMGNKITEPDTDEDIKAAFKVFDQDGKGFVTSDDIEKLLDGLGFELTRQDISDVTGRASAEGHIDYEDFLRSYQGE